MDQISKALTDKADSLFADMSKDMMDLGDGGGMNEPCCLDKGEPYYPSIEIPMGDAMKGCMPGEEVKLIAIGMVDSVNMKTMRVKIKSAAMVPETGSEDQNEPGE